MKEFGKREEIGIEEGEKPIALYYAVLFFCLFCFFICFVYFGAHNLPCLGSLWTIFRKSERAHVGRELWIGPHNFFPHIAF